MEKENFEKESSKIPDLEQQIIKLSNELGQLLEQKYINLPNKLDLKRILSFCSLFGVIRPCIQMSAFHYTLNRT